MSNLNSINKNIELEKKSVKDSETLEKMRLKFLGKKGEITLLMKDLGKMNPEERKAKAEHSGRCNNSRWQNDLCTRACMRLSNSELCHGHGR